MFDQETKTGFVTLPASYVFERALTVQCEIEEKREAKRKEWLQGIMDGPTKSRFFPKPALTEEEAIKAVKANDDLYWYYWALEAENKTPKQKLLDRLVNVAYGMIQRQAHQENTDMVLTIEAAELIL